MELLESVPLEIERSSCRYWTVRFLWSFYLVTVHAIKVESGDAEDGRGGSLCWRLYTFYIEIIKLQWIFS